MNDIQIFNYNNNQIRVVEKDGAAWFIAKDVCDVLGLGQVSRALQGLKTDGRLLKVTHPQNPNKLIEVNAVNEPGLYKLIFKSRKPEAKQFQDWVFYEVLPDIRKYGMYLGDQAREAAITDPETFNAVLRAYAQEKEKVKALESKIQDDAPFVTIGKVVLSLPGSVTIADAAQFMAQHGIKIGRNRLMRLLRDKGLLSKQRKRWNKPTQLGIDKGLVNIELDYEGNYQFTPRPMITSKGLQNITFNLFTTEYPLAALFAQAEEE